MKKLERYLLFLVLAFLFAASLGGFFNKVKDLRSKESIGQEREAILQEPQIADKQEQGQTEEIRKSADQPRPVNQQELIEEAQEAIEDAQELIIITEEFIEKQKTKEILNDERRYVSENKRGVYMTGLIAISQDSAAKARRQEIIDMILETELNAVVIDVKEAEGPYNIKSFVSLVDELRKKGIWTIARIVVFADASMAVQNPSWYCQSKSGAKPWQDYSRRYWLDPGNEEARNYLIAFSKQVIDAGFDELQFDYIRFPSDGDLSDLVCPASLRNPKDEIIGGFFAELSRELKLYKKEIVLSVDLFGLAAVRFNLYDIGQKIQDAAKAFDYISFMLYPSHFYGGFEAQADQRRQLPYIYFPYVSQDVSNVVSNHPYEVVFRSLLSAQDYLSSLGLPANFRPWLQDFNLKVDTDRGIIYGKEQVRAQIQAVEDAGVSGWLLWNPGNVYSAEALRE